MKHTHTEGSGSIIKPLFAALFVCALAAPSARAAVPADFSKTFTVTVPAGLVDAGETLASFPLLLRLGTGIAGFDYADFRQNGADILVTDASGNALPYELENWDTSGESRLWVRVPSVAEGTTLSVYYGTAETVAPPAGVWSGYAGVWHLNEAGDGTTTIADSTANKLDGTSHASSKARSDGKLGAARGLELGGKNGAMTTVPSSAVLDALVPTFTVSGWVRPRTLAMNWGYLFARKTSDADPSWGLQFRASDNANTVGIYSNGSADNDDNRAVFATSGKFTANTWTKYAVVYDNTTIRLYLDGALVASKPANPGAAVNKSNGFGIGGFPTSANHSSLQADQDEVRLMNGAASAVWVAAEYRQESGAVALSYGAVGDMDATAPVVAAPVLSRDPATGAFTVTAELSARVPASVICDADGVTNAMTTADAALPMTYAATLADLAANTSYACLVAATSTGGTVTETACPTAFHTGDLSVSKVSDAYESGLVPGAFRISRADTAHDLAVSYTVGGTATAGQTYEALSGKVTIPAGSSSVDVPVQPLRDRQTDANATVVLTLAAGLYGIDAGAGSAELTIVNHRVAQPTDFRKKMTFTPSATVLATIGESAFSDFPVLVRLPAEASALLRSANGTDLFFTDENDAELSFEVDTFDPAGETLVWVKVPSLSASTELTAYFGGAANEDNVPADVWSRYAVVVHGGDSLANAIAGGPAVSAGSSSVAADADAGKIGGGVRKSDYNTIGVNAANVASALANTGKFSVSAWFKRSSGSGNNTGTHILAASRPGWNEGSGFVWLNEQNKYIAISAPNTHQWSSGNDKLAEGVWAHVAFAYEKGVSLTSFFNGAQDNRKTSDLGNLENTSGTWTFGSYANTASADSFKGDMDELRVFDGVASGDWIALEYATMADAAFFGAGQIEDVDVSAPFVGVPVITYAAGVFSVSAEISTNVPASVFCDADGVTNAMTTVDAELPMTYSAAISGLMEDTTYRCSVLAVSTGGSTISETCPTAFYNGDLAVAKISDADETGLVPGSFRISRSDSAYDLAVSYTVGGTAVSGRNYAALSGTATIPAGSTFVDIEVTPILDAQTDADTTVVLTLSAGLYGIDAVAGSAELNVINHHFAQPIDFAKKMTLAPSETILATIGESTFADFPVLVRLPAEVSAEFRTADGSDLVVTDENGTSLPFEVEAFDSAGTTFVWVKVPSLSASTELTVWFGGASNVDNDPTAVWSRYVGVWHYAPSEADGTSVADATGHGLTGSTTGELSTYAGPFGCDAIHSTAVVTAPDYDALVPVASQFTASGWFKLPSWVGGNGNYFYFASKKVGLNWDNANGWYVQMNQSKTNMGIVLGGNESFATIPDVSANWNHFCVVSDGTTVMVYMNGASAASISASHVIKASGTTFAISPNKTDNCADEYRIRAGAASAAETALEYATMADADFFDAGAIKDVDVSAPFVGVPVITYAAGVFSVSAEISTNVPASVFCDADGVTNAMTTVDAELPMTYSAMLTGLLPGKTYACLVAATSTGGTVTEMTCPTVFYNGNLAVAKISDADETGLVPGSFRISRADSAYDLAVAYTVGGTAVSGRNYAALSGTATIPAGSTFVDIEVTPILDAQTDADTTVVLTLSAGLYGIDAVAESAELNVINHHFAQPIDFAKKMTLAPSETALAKIGETAWADFPVLVRLPAEVSDQLRSANGTDLFFTDENDAVLSYEVDTYNPAGETLVWVKVPSLSSATELTVYFGGAANVDNDPTAVWTNYAGVWHMNEASGTVADATGNGLGASPAKATAVSIAQTAGAVGTARQTATSDVKDYLTIPNYNSLGVGGNFTFSCFYDATARKGYDRLVSRKETHDAGNGWEVEMANASDKLSARGASATSISGTFSDLVSSGWMRFTFVYSGTTLRAYLNGAQIGTGTITAATDNGKPLSIGCDSDGSEAYFVGYVDEARLRKGAASAAEVALEYATMKDEAFFEMGAVESVDATAQVFDTPTIVRNANGTYTVTVVLSENSGGVGVIYDAGETAITNILATAANPGTYTDTPANLTADTTYKFAAYGKNANGTEVVAKGGIFYNGDISVTKVSDADENGLVPGVFRISRVDTAHDLAVAYTVEGTATPGQTFETLSGTATIPAGSTSVDVEVVPLLDADTTEDTTVVLTLNAGLYGIDAQAGSAEMTVVNLVAPVGYNTWIAPADGLASVGSNWSTGNTPTSSDNILFDGRFSTANCEWDSDASATVASWTQTNGYTGTVTLKTVYPGKGDFQCLTVTGPMAVMSGAITHPQSRTMGDNHPATWDWLGDLLANETYRLRLAVGSLTVGADGLLDAKGKGYRVTHGNAQVNASHGGRASQAAQRCYGDPKEPIHIGLADKTQGDGGYYNGKGGGAIYVTSAGPVVVDGTIRADSDREGTGCCGAAGSVYLNASSVSGTGTISAYGPGSGDGNNKGTGGRVAIVTDDPVDRTTFASITADSARLHSANRRATRFGGAGTVFFQDRTRPNGLLVVGSSTDALSPTWDQIYATASVTTDGDWTFDAVEFGRFGFLVVPAGTTLTLPNGLASCTGVVASASAVGGIRYEGGTLDIGSGPQTIAGNWMFCAWSNYVFQADVTVKNGGLVGVHPINERVESETTLPAFVSCDLAVDGDLTVESTGAIVATDCGFRKNRSDTHNGVLGFHSHGGRTLRWGRPDALFYEGYDSIFSPRLPGCSVPVPDGQTAGRCGGAVKLVVSGTLTLNGPANANGFPESHNGSGNASGGAGGSLDFTAGRLAGSGSITADGGSYAWQRGPGGRIAVKLTGAGAGFADFAGEIRASGRAVSPGGAEDASAGTVYLQTAADGDKGGTILIAMREGNRFAGNTNTTEMVSLGYGGDAIADYKHVKYVVRDYGRAAVNVDMKAASIEIADVNSILDLEGHTLTVKSAKVNGVKLSPGTYGAGSDVAIGERTLGDYLIDTVTGGELIVGGVGLSILVR